MKRITVWYQIGNEKEQRRYIHSGSVMYVLRKFKQEIPQGRVIKVEEQHYKD